MSAETVGIRTASAFERARAEDSAALIGYLPAGFPTLAGGIAAIHAMIESGVDLVEIGFPYSDPVMDGPVIQRATEVALSEGITAAGLLRTVEAASTTGVPVLVMTYWNPMERYGISRFARDLAAAGGAGLITPDLIPEEAEEWFEASDQYNLDRVFLVAPSSTDTRVAMTTSACRGFVYAASLMGVTGARATVSGAAPELVRRVRSVGGETPVAVGLGVGNRAQAAEVAGYADGVIVGSALVRCLLEARDGADGLAAVRSLAGDLASGTREPGRG